ncbi:MAG: hypothetical protein Ct9H300mP29_1330 [Candidatus Neomarinimicrobiota bacterium]|nr:MAG: hypothetical protein Ct9H300mP29_1330 [Candidatus Neomarinimicrobiota bacterium]
MRIKTQLIKFIILSSFLLGQVDLLNSRFIFTPGKDTTRQSNPRRITWDMIGD